MKITNKRKYNLITVLITIMIMVGSFGILTASDKLPIGDTSQDTEKIKERVRGQLLRLNNYSAFDFIEFEVTDSKVILSGWVSKPSLKNDASRVVLKLEEIENVDNQLEVLPSSRNDDTIRYQAYSAIYRHPSLTRYAPGGGMTFTDSRRFRQELHFGLESTLQPRGPHPIHIIVKNGRVELMGFVSRDSEKSIAEIVVNGIPGVFTVVNHIQTS